MLLKPENSCYNILLKIIPCVGGLSGCAVRHSTSFKGLEMTPFFENCLSNAFQRLAKDLADDLDAHLWDLTCIQPAIQTTSGLQSYVTYTISQ